MYGRLDLYIGLGLLPCARHATDQRALPIAVRLVEGSYTGQGNLQIWSSIYGWMYKCDSGWSDSNARVVCRMLGLWGGYATYGSYFGNGWTDYVQIGWYGCSGTESQLYDCNYYGTTSACSIYTYAGVVCSLDPPTTCPGLHPGPYGDTSVCACGYYDACPSCRY